MAEESEFIGCGWIVEYLDINKFPSCWLPYLFEFLTSTIKVISRSSRIPAVPILLAAIIFQFHFPFSTPRGEIKYFSSWAQIIILEKFFLFVLSSFLVFSVCSGCDVILDDDVGHFFLILILIFFFFFFRKISPRV